MPERPPSPRGAELPVASTAERGWTLVDDEAGGDKGVEKMGYASSALGSALLLGPIRGPTSMRCANLEAELGFLSRPPRGRVIPGSIHVRCVGCACARQQGPYSKRLSPFPVIPTNEQLSSDPSRKGNFSITATSSFEVLWNASQPCYFNLTHAKAANFPRGGSGAFVSRVRVDSLSLSIASANFTLLNTAYLWAHLSKYPGNFRAALKVRHTPPPASQTRPPSIPPPPPHSQCGLGRRRPSLATPRFTRTRAVRCAPAAAAVITSESASSASMSC